MRKGFTLIELMIVVAIIAIVASIAIPSLLRARQAANEGNAAAALKGMCGNQAVWRRTDADGNGIKDYWCGDIRAFYAMEDAGGNQLKYIDVAFAKADFLPSAFAAWVYGLTYPNGMVGGPTGATPKQGYYFLRQVINEYGQIYPQDTSPNDGVFNPFNNVSDWAMTAFPAAYNRDGIRVFIVNSAGVVYGVDSGRYPIWDCGWLVMVWPGSDPTTTLAAGGRYWGVAQD